MSIEFSCESCQKRFKVGDEMAGRRVRCKACQAVIVVPAGDALPPAPEPLPLDFEPAGEPVVPPLPIPIRSGARPPAIPARYCPGCRVPLSMDARVCTNCGYDTRTGRISEAAGKPKFSFVTSFSLLRVAAALAVITLLFIAKISLFRPSASPSGVQSRTGPEPSGQPAAAPRATSRPVYPQRPTAQEIDTGTRAYSMTIGGAGPGLPMEVMLLLPTGSDSPKSLPCVFVAPAGTRLIHGNKLGGGDMPELVPYVHAGFAVVAYELSGEVPNDDGGSISFQRLQQPMQQFMAADGGLDNARNAVGFVLAKVPEVDPDRLFAAGHSSAATMALNVVANDHRFRAAAAYAPRCDVEADFAGQALILDTLVPGSSEFLKRISPIRHVADISCPVLLFHADDDSRIPTADNQAFATAMSNSGKEIVFTRVPHGGHYQSMIDHGIGAGIAFFQAHGAGANKSPAINSRPAP